MRSWNILRAAALALLLLAAASCGGGGETTTGPRTNLHPEDLVPEVQVQAVDFSFRNGSLSDDNLAIDPVLQLIASATSSLDIAVTRINRQELVTALLSEAQAGTNIRIVTEKAFYDDPVYQPFYAQLENAAANNGNIAIVTDAEGLPRMMHARFLIIDNARVVTGSYNWETATNQSSFGDVISILNTSIAAAFATQFNQMFVERLFGVNKRDDSAHVFGVGGVENGAPRATVEVYFGPTDRPRELITSEFALSQNAVFGVQQFSDAVLGGTVQGYLGAGRNLVACVNDFGEAGDQQEDAIYSMLVGGTFAVDDTQVVAVNGIWNDLNDDGQMDFSEFSHWLPKQTAGAVDEFIDFNVMNHKLLYADHAFGGAPTVMSSSANWDDLGFSLNDEVFIFMRGLSLTNKYFRGINYMNSVPPAVLEQAGDVQELDQLTTMFPFIASPAGQNYRPFLNTPTGIVFGEVPNFRETIDIAQSDGTIDEDVPVDISFSIFGTTYFGIPVGSSHKDATGRYDDTFPLGTDFVTSSNANPDREYMLVLPAGNFTIVVDTFPADSSSLIPFEQTSREVDLGPGGVRKATLRMGRPEVETGGGA